MAREHEKYNLTNDNSAVSGPPGGAHDLRRLATQRSPLPLGRSPQAPLRVGVRPPDHWPAAAAAPPLAPLVGRTPLIRVQAPGGQGVALRDASASPQQQKEGSGGGVKGVGAGGGGLQEQVQLLATEVRGLGLALKILVDQQSRIEREQVQQTRVQKQILGALQGLASRLGPCSRGQQQQQQHDKTPPLPLPHPPPPPAALPTSAAAASFGEDTFAYNHGAYDTPCSQAPSTYNPLDGLAMAEAFKLPEQRNMSMNGFPPCSNAESSLSQPYPQTHGYTTSYAQTSAQAFAQWTTVQPFRGLEGKGPDFPSGCLEGSLQDCSVPGELVVNSNRLSRDDQLDIVKVEIL